MEIESYSPPRRLLDLPYEIRSMIWDFTLSDVTFSFRKGDPEDNRKTKDRSPSHALAITQACRQIHTETALWARRVSFEFGDIESLLDRLSPLPTEKLATIGHVTVSSTPLMLTIPGADYEIYYRIGSALALLPGIRLDTLTIDCRDFYNGAPFNAEAAYDTVRNAVERSNGWRQLRLIAPSSRLLAWKSSNMHVGHKGKREPQPCSWTRMLSVRDGEGSKSFIKIWRTKRSGHVMDVFNHNERELFHQEPDESKQYGGEEDESLVREGEESKSMLVLVKRDRDVDCTQVDSEPRDLEDIRLWAGEKSWPEIKEEQANMYPLDADESYWSWLALFGLIKSAAKFWTWDKELRHDLYGSMVVSYTGMPWIQ